MSDYTASGRDGACVDPKPLLDWIDAHPGCMSGWAAGGKGRGKQSSGWMGPARANAAKRVQSWRKGTKANFHAIDRVCCLLGVHMSQVPGYEVVYWTTRLEPWAPGELDERVRADRRRRQRERLRTDPEWRERRNAQARERRRRQREAA